MTLIWLWLCHTEELHWTWLRIDSHIANTIQTTPYTVCTTAAVTRLLTTPSLLQHVCMHRNQQHANTSANSFAYYSWSQELIQVTKLWTCHNFDGCNAMAAEGWVTISKRISAVFGSKVTASRSTFRGHCRLTLAFLFVDATFRSRDMRCRVRKWRKSGSKFDDFCTPHLGAGSPKIFGGICKSTPLLTYLPSLVEIPWLVFHLCWRNKK